MTKQLTPLRRKDQATGYQAAVKDIVAWMKDKASYAWSRENELADLLEAKFGNTNVAD